MKEATPDLSPDLEWMLQGRQASPALILETMVAEYAGEVIRLTACLLGDPSLALYAAFDTFASVLENRHRYYGRMGVRLFIYSQAVKVVRRYLPEARLAAVSGTADNSPGVVDEPEALLASAIADLGDDLKITLALQLIPRLSNEEIAWVMQTKPERVQANIQKAYRALGKKLPELIDENQPLPEVVSACFEKCSQTSELEDISQAQIIQAVEYAIERKKQTGRVRAYALQTALGVGVVLTLAVIGWITSRIASPQTPLPLAARTVIITQIVRVPVFVTPTPRPKRPMAELSPASSPQEIRDRIIENDYLWSTLWTDAYIYDYGPAGYVGTPLVRREQMWISQPSRGLLISGSPTGKVDNRWHISENSLYYLLNVLPKYYYRPLSADSFHSFLIFQPKSWARAGLPMSVVEEINTLGREALVVDVRSQDGYLLGRITVDKELGFVLSIRLYDRDGITVVGDVYLNKLAVDVALPDEIFDTDMPIEYFFEDPLARTPDRTPEANILSVAAPGHEPYPKITPPASLDLSRSHLVLQWSQPPFGQSDKLVMTPVDIFADGFYWGTISVGNPWSAICGRSPNGLYLAIVEQPEMPPFPSSRMRWFRLDNLEDDHELLPKGSLYGSYFAFSPDSRHLAFWGCGGHEDNCGVYLLDFNNQKLKKFLAGRYAGYFVWHPDGDELAMLRADDTLTVVDVNTAKITYRAYMDWITFIVPPDAPLKDWGVEFPPPLMGLQGCALPGSN